MEPETGVAYDVLKKDEEPQPVAVDPDEPVVEKVVFPKKVFIPEVVREKRMIFFREPRLGSWLGVDMTYKSSLTRVVTFI